MATSSGRGARRSKLNGASADSADWAAKPLTSDIETQPSEISSDGGKVWSHIDDLAKKQRNKPTPWGSGAIIHPPLVAIPVFVLMGQMLDRSGMAEKLMMSISRLFGRLNGGTAIAVVIIGRLLAASTGGAGLYSISLSAVCFSSRQPVWKSLKSRRTWIWTGK
jgi:hypothetical protein